MTDQWRHDETNKDYHDLMRGDRIMGYVHRQGSRWYWSLCEIEWRHFGRCETLAGAKRCVVEAVQKVGEKPE